jgi:hypothetical protein
MLTSRKNNLSSLVAGFYEYLPTGYDGVKKFPLIVFMHGHGHIGNGDSDLYVLATMALPAYLNKGMQIPFVVVMPQCSAWPTAGTVKDVIDYAVKNYAIDTERIYVTGMSMGGAVTWEFAGQYPDIAACVVPVCPAYATDEAGLQKIAKAGLKVIGYHAKDDTVCGYASTERPVNRLNELGITPKAEMTLYEKGGHNIWDGVYEPANNLYDTLLKYKRNAAMELKIKSYETKYLTHLRGGISSIDMIYGANSISDPRFKIQNTTEQGVYQYERWGDFFYEIPVDNGSYIIVLKFAELFYNKKGDRKFNVVINGQKVLSDYDILAEVPKFTAIEKTFVADVTNGILKIEFSDGAKISEIIVSGSDAPAPPPPNQIKTEAEFTFPGGKYILFTDGKWIKKA